MADPGPSPAVPVWLSEDDLGCIICHGLLSWPVTLPCGHSFCRHCLTHLWDSRDARRRWACPTCREGAAQPPRLRKNTLLQDLADKYSRAAREPDADPAPAARAAPPRVAIPKNLTEVGEELTGLVEQLVDIVRSLQSQRCPLEPGPDGGLSAEGAAFSSGVDLSLAAPKHVTSSASEGKMGDVLRGLEEIQEKLRESFTWKEAPEEHTRVEVPEAPSTSACPLPNQNCPAPKRASRFAQWAISPTFDLRSVSHSLWVSEDQRTVTVSHHPQSYPWSRERFSISQQATARGGKLSRYSSPCSSTCPVHNHPLFYHLQTRCSEMAPPLPSTQGSNPGRGAGFCPSCPSSSPALCCGPGVQWRMAQVLGSCTRMRDWEKHLAPGFGSARCASCSAPAAAAIGG
ncbi:E3 ubiquitin-protein ligase RNF135 isoform X3 [Lepus europaeus]|uniref:E3 ubiquitin-protein ligase RNF135 isoform X3 n=1 Tax=Lepus europaeus TaxID=9983 RepID=UPI002B4A0E88|nr:E3 ubiquitin-protein ligase RNF135 isoform X3 [Lepus europaeus]